MDPKDAKRSHLVEVKLRRLAPSSFQQRDELRQRARGVVVPRRRRLPHAYSTSSISALLSHRSNKVSTQPCSARAAPHRGFAYPPGTELPCHSTLRIRRAMLKISEGKPST